MEKKSGSVRAVVVPVNWNHNTHYHRLVLNAVPSDCHRALDVGCGEGLLARRLAAHCGEVVGIDADHDTLERARAAPSESRIQYVEADAMKYPFPENSFDLITSVASLHHLPLAPAVTRFRSLLRPGGTLAVVGLYREHSLVDYCWAAVAVPASRTMACLYPNAEVGAPVRAPGETLTEIRTACDDLLPGLIFRRLLFFRYWLSWKKPDGN